jgi:hypothetical protein
LHGRLSNPNLDLFEKVFESLPKYYPGFSNLTKRSSPKFDEFLNI